MSGLLSVGADVGQTVSLIKENGQTEPCAVVAPPAAGPNIEPLTITFNHTNGIQLFVVTVPGVKLASSSAWVSLGGPQPNAGGPQELAGVGGCYVSNDDEVTVIATYPGSQTIFPVPILVFWIN